MRLHMINQDNTKHFPLYQNNIRIKSRMNASTFMNYMCKHGPGLTFTDSGDFFFREKLLNYITFLLYNYDPIK